MRPALHTLFAAVFLIISGHVLADQTDPRLDQLFDALQSDEDTVTMHVAEQMIWATWRSYPTMPDLEDKLMAAQSLARVGEFQQAATMLGEITDVAPDYAEAWNRRAIARYHLGEYDGAISDIAQTLSLEPRHFGALSGLGLIYIRVGRAEEAIAAFEAALDIHPGLSGLEETIATLEEVTAGEAL